MDLWGEVEVVELDRAVAESAGELAERHRLRAYDAVHLASAVALGRDVIFTSWDPALRDAASHAGLDLVPA